MCSEVTAPVSPNYYDCFEINQPLPFYSHWDKSKSNTLKGQFNIRNHLELSPKVAVEVIISSSNILSIILETVLHKTTNEEVDEEVVEVQITSNMALVNFSQEGGTWATWVLKDLQQCLLLCLNLISIWLNTRCSNLPWCHLNHSWQEEDLSKCLELEQAILTLRQSSASSLIRVSSAILSRLNSKACKLIFIFVLGKACPFKERCNFAHGDQDLRRSISEGSG